MWPITRQRAVKVVCQELLPQGWVHDVLDWLSLEGMIVAVRGEVTVYLWTKDGKGEAHHFVAQSTAQREKACS